MYQVCGLTWQFLWKGQLRIEDGNQNYDLVFPQKCHSYKYIFAYKIGYFVVTLYVDNYIFMNVNLFTEMCTHGKEMSVFINVFVIVSLF